MKIIKQTLFRIELSKFQTSWDETFFVEAGDLEEALYLAKEVINKHYKEWYIKSINVHSPVFKSTTRTITVEV